MRKKANKKANDLHLFSNPLGSAPHGLSRSEHILPTNVPLPAASPISSTTTATNPTICSTIPANADDSLDDFIVCGINDTPRPPTCNLFSEDYFRTTMDQHIDAVRHHSTTPDPEYHAPGGTWVEMASPARTNGTWDALYMHVVWRESYMVGLLAGALPLRGRDPCPLTAP
jgi:hypothetical protein